jgi:virginiamycin B lyase
MFVSPLRSLRRLSQVAAVLVATAVGLLATAAATRAATVQTFQIPTAGADLNTMVEGPDGNVYFTADQDSGGLFHVGELTTGGQVNWIPVPFGQADTSGDRMGPTSIVSSGGLLWFLSDVGESLYQLQPGATSVGAPLQPENLPDGSFQNGEQLAPAPGGAVWMTTEPGSSVALINANGTGRYIPANRNTTTSTVVETPGGAALYDNGGDSLASVDANGTPTSYTLPSSIGAGDVYSMVYDRSGNLWYSAYNYSFLTGGFDATIGEVPAGSTTGETIDSLDPSSGRGPYATDLTLGPDGAIWFTWTSTPDGVHAKMPSGIGRLDPSTGQIQYADLVASNSLLPSSLAFGGDGNLYFLDNVDNLVGRVVSPSALFATTTSPGPTGPGPTPAKGPLAPAAHVTVPHTTLRAIGRRHQMDVRCRLAGAGRCALALQVTPALARHLGEKVAKHAKTVTLARAAGTLKRAGTARLHLRFSRKLSHRLARRHSLAAVLVARSTAKGARARTVRKRITLHRS